MPYLYFYICTLILLSFSLSPFVFILFFINFHYSMFLYFLLSLPFSFSFCSFFLSLSLIFLSFFLSLLPLTPPSLSFSLIHPTTCGKVKKRKIILIPKLFYFESLGNGNSRKYGGSVSIQSQIELLIPSRYTLTS